MGLLDTIGGAIGTVADIATDFIPGQIDDRIVDLAGSAIGSAIGSRGGRSGGGSSRGSRRRRGGSMAGSGSGPSAPVSPVARGGSGSGGGVQFQGPSFGGTLNIPGLPGVSGNFELPSGGLQVGGGDGNGQAMTTQRGGGMVASSFQGALGQMMLKKSIRSKSGRAILEAMQSGALQRGLIQPTTTVQTPRGTENHSPPGFRTVYINEQPFAVFKPLAQALRLLPKRSRSKITAADMKTIRDADRLTGKIKKIAKKTGNLKVTNK